METAIERICFVGVYGHNQNDMLIDGLAEHDVAVAETGINTDADGSLVHRLPIYPMKPTLNWFGRFPSMTLPFLFAVTFLIHAALTWGAIARNYGEVRQADVLVVPHLGDTAVLLVAPLARLLGLPLVYISHNGMYFTLVENREAYTANSVAGIFLYELDRLIQSVADSVIVFSEYSGDVLSEAFGIPRERYASVYIGSPPDKFTDAKGGDPPGPVDVLYWGNFIPHHSVDTMVEAAAALPDYEFVFAGKSDHRETIMHRADELDIENVSFPGFVSDAALLANIETADVVLGPLGDYTQTSMNIGTKVAEAASMRKPIVLGDHPAPNEVFVHRESAYLVPPEDPEALADSLASLLEDPELRSTLERGSYRVYEEYFAPPRTAAQFLAAADAASERAA